MEIVNIPRERVKALRGQANQTLEMLKERMKVGLEVYGEGTVEIEGEPVDEFFAKDVIRAIGRGFDHREALKLLSDEYSLHVIDLRDYAHKPDAVARLKGRIIGLEGKARHIIEQEAEVDLSIHGHTVAIIGRLELMRVATTAIFKIIEGQPHSSVYLYLEKLKRKRKQEEMIESKSGKMTKK